MSFYDYKDSQRISSNDHPFYALIMAAMRQADTVNIEKLKAMFPEIHAELDERYHAPAGITTRECFQHIAWMAQTLHQAYHMEEPGTWQECPKDICISTVRFFTEGPT
jgi:hypothetical protein